MPKEQELEEMKSIILESLRGLSVSNSATMYAVNEIAETLQKFGYGKVSSLKSQYNALVALKEQLLEEVESLEEEVKRLEYENAAMEKEKIWVEDEEWMNE